MSKKKRVPMQAGDKVSHKGNLWTVANESNGLVQMTRDGQRKVVRLN